MVSGLTVACMASKMVVPSVIAPSLPCHSIVQPPDWSTVQIRIFNMIHFARDEEVAALCVMLIAAVVLPALVYVLTFNRKVELL